MTFDTFRQLSDESEVNYARRLVRTRCIIELSRKYQSLRQSQGWVDIKIPNSLQTDAVMKIKPGLTFLYTVLTPCLSLFVRSWQAHCWPSRQS